MRRIMVLLGCLVLGFAVIGCQKKADKKEAACDHASKKEVKKCTECAICLKCGELKGGEKCCKTEGREKCEKCGLLKGSIGCCKIPKECCGSEKCKEMKAKKKADEHKGHDHGDHKGHDH